MTPESSEKEKQKSCLWESLSGFVCEVVAMAMMEVWYLGDKFC